jgi:hypothetical protein
VVVAAAVFHELLVEPVRGIGGRLPDQLSQDLMVEVTVEKSAIVTGGFQRSVQRLMNLGVVKPVC